LSLKENIEAIKEELSAEEKFLESVIKTESFYKKHKKAIIGALVAVALGIFGSVGYNYYQEQKALKSNDLYLSLLQNPDDANKKKELSSLNPKLYDLFLMQTAMKKADVKELEKLKTVLKDDILKDLVTYQVASLKESGLLEYASSSKAMLKDFARLNSAYLHMQKGDTEKAKEILDNISPTSTLFQVAQSLKHYMK